MTALASLGSNGTAPGRRVSFNCPGCNDYHQVVVESPTGWGWNGSLESPTFTPSVLVRMDFTGDIPSKVCHSFVTDGRIEFLGDCTHGLAGQTVDLPPWRADQ